LSRERKKFKYSPELSAPSQLVTKTVNEAKGRLFKRKDGKYLIYVPVDLAEDSMFPFQTNSAIPVKISFKVGHDKLQVEKWNKETEL
jgi:hypothetical protein